MADLIRQDPVGLTEIISDTLGSTAPGLSANVARRGYVSEDGRSRLVMAQPTRPPYDTRFSRALDARLQRDRRCRPRQASESRAADLDEPLPPLQVEFAGGHRIALETEAVVRRESILNTVGSLALILPLLFFAFRSLWLVLVGVAAVGAVAAGGPRHSRVHRRHALGRGGGIGRHAVRPWHGRRRAAVRRPSPRRGRRDAARTGWSTAIAGPSSSMLLGMWTTAATFYGLTFVDFPSLQQLGLLIGHSMMICGILTLVLVPALLPRSVSPRRAPPA